MAKVEIKEQVDLDFRSNESYKSLRTNIQFCGSDIKVIGITSCLPNEGKSSVCVNLARSFADSGKKVLLIDADLRKSVLIGGYKIMGPIKGFSHFLSKQASFEEVLCETDVKNFHIIFAGQAPPNPAELLGKDQF
ncbi:MAG: CpsD/CapB family tyrosine-protein kinase, partial [Lachnospiraceae bacterium]